MLKKKSNAEKQQFLKQCARARGKLRQTLFFFFGLIALYSNDQGLAETQPKRLVSFETNHLLASSLLALALAPVGPDSSVLLKILRLLRVLCCSIGFLGGSNFGEFISTCSASLLSAAMIEVIHHHQNAVKGLKVNIEKIRPLKKNSKIPVHLPPHFWPPHVFFSFVLFFQKQCQKTV